MLIQKKSYPQEPQIQLTSNVLIFIDRNIEHFEQILAGIMPSAQAYIIESCQDGVATITHTLQHQNQVEAIHIVSHGSPGCLDLGNTKLSLNTLQHYSQKLSEWRNSHSDSPPSLYLYGCNVAAGDAGEEFIKTLHQQSSLPIFASQTRTGSPQLGGDWSLEVSIGSHSKAQRSPFFSQLQTDYQGVLATQLIKDINPSEYTGSYPERLDVVGNKLFFVADDGVTGRELWVSDGTEEGTRLVKDINSDNDTYSYYSYNFPPDDFIEVNGQLFFTADDGETGTELWVSDGTTSGTQLVQDINPDNDPEPYTYPTNPSNFIEINGQLFFTADDGETGTELWVSDGTEEGTRLVKDINPDNAPYSYTEGPSQFFEFNGQLFFTANDGSTGTELWVSDGTEEGTRMIKDINPNNDPYSYAAGPSQLSEFNGQLFFTANDGSTGTELWVSDGTEEGTRLVKNINLEDDPYSYAFPSDFIAVNGQLFFTADDGVTGRELWVSDGTEEGTRLVKDINAEAYPSYYSYSPSDFTEVNGQLFFTADDGVTGRELWVSDGTEAGTRLVKDINPDDESGYFYYPYTGNGPQDLLNVDGLLFFTADDGVTGRELWVSDGTKEGTRLVKDITPDNEFGYVYDGPSNFIVANGILYFTATDALTGRELWRSDGTESGTQRITDINVGLDGSFPSNLTLFENQLFFNAEELRLGNELWSITLPDNIIRGDGDDNSLRGTAKIDLISGRGGNDIIRAVGGDDTVDGGAGDDQLRGGKGNDELQGREGNDSLFGNSGDDRLDGGSGDDSLLGNIGADIFTISPGNDHLNGGTGQDTAEFQISDESITVFLPSETSSFAIEGVSYTSSLVNIENISGSQFDDLIIGDNDANLLSGLAGDDVIGGRKGNDTLNGNTGKDVLRGGTGRDQLIGGTGNDTLRGDQGSDTLNGGAGDDVLIGNKGADVFLFGSDLLDDGNDDSDVINSFERVDSLDFTDYISAGGTVAFTRVTPELLRIDLSGEDAINIFGSIQALNIAEGQLGT